MDRQGRELLNNLTIALCAAPLFAGGGPNPVAPEALGPEYGQEPGTAGEAGNEGGEAGEPGALCAMSETARQSRSGVDPARSFDRATASFAGTVTNPTAAPVAGVRVEIHLSNGVEPGPTPLLTLNPSQASPVARDARGQEFTTWQVHLEIGRDEP